MLIGENYLKIREKIPSYVKIVVAAKTRTVKEIEELIEAGATDIGQNYVQEAEAIFKKLKDVFAKKICWHMIGPLQKNKINKALPIFDFIQTVDSFELAAEIDKRVIKAGKEIMPILLEINIGSEISKHGIRPDKHEKIEEYLDELINRISSLSNIRLEGLMTMGPLDANLEQLRQYFRRTRNLFEHIANLKLKNINMKYLSMGMTDSYQIAIEEGANVVRIGTAIFGPR